MNHTHGHKIVSIDVETTGTNPGWNEIVQIAVVPLDDHLEPVGAPFYTQIAPEHPERIDPSSWAIHGLDLDDLLYSAPSQERAADMLVEWMTRLKLPVDRRLIPLAHNYTFEYGFIKAWLGHSGMGNVLHFHPRDGMILALALKDRAAVCGLPQPFESVSLTNLSKHFGVVNTKPHDALADAIAEARVYKALISL